MIRWLGVEPVSRMRSVFIPMCEAASQEHTTRYPALVAHQHSGCAEKRTLSSRLPRRGELVEELIPGCRSQRNLSRLPERCRGTLVSLWRLALQRHLVAPCAKPSSRPTQGDAIRCSGRSGVSKPNASSENGGKGTTMKTHLLVVAALLLTGGRARAQQGTEFPSIPNFLKISDQV